MKPALAAIFILGGSVLSAENGIQSRIDAASAAGGGVVRLEAGVHVSPALRMKTGVTLHLAKGAVLQADTDLSAYAATEGHAFILADGCRRVEIAGGDLAVGNRSEAGKTVKGTGR